MKKGFGLLEVMLAAVVLGFLIVALTRVQMGNRESIVRVRTRDAANFIANHVLDSLGSVGINSLIVSDDPPGRVFSNPKYVYSFEGKQGIAQVVYDVKVDLLPASAEHSKSESTNFTTASEEPINTINTYNKKLEATVSWKFKNSTQAISVAKVVR